MKQIIENKTFDQECALYNNVDGLKQALGTGDAQATFTFQ